MMFLAQATTTPAAKTPPAWYQIMSPGTFPLVIGIAVVYFYLIRKKGTDKGTIDKLKNLKRGDRIQTIGGIVGTVVDAREDEVVVKVDETNNSKITFIRKAIATVVEDSKSAK
jgi:preprotein translocase subunit YajC